LIPQNPVRGFGFESDEEEEETETQNLLPPKPPGAIKKTLIFDCMI
jgi:hypothetical protein